MKSVKHLWASLLIVMAFVIICPSALAATGNSSQVHSENPVDAYPNSTIGVIHFYIDDGKLIVYNPDERTSVRGDAGTATIYWTIPGQVFWSISSNISGPMVFSGSVSTTAGDYCPLNGISFDGYVSGLVDVQMMPGSNYATLETSVYKGYKRDKIEMRGDRAEMSDFPLYLNTVAGGLDRRDQTIGGFSFVVKIYAVPVVEIIG